MCLDLPEADLHKPAKIKQVFYQRQFFEIQVRLTAEILLQHLQYRYLLKPLDVATADILHQFGFLFAAFQMTINNTLFNVFRFNKFN